VTFEQSITVIIARRSLGLRLALQTDRLQCFNHSIDQERNKKNYKEIIKIARRQLREEIQSKKVRNLTELKRKIMKMQTIVLKFTELIETEYNYISNS
jgi:hypothetical protein